MQGHAVEQLQQDAPDGPGPLKEALRLVDEEPVLDAPLLSLGRWIAQYYCAPLGEVLRSMLPLMAEVRRSISYRISEAGLSILVDGAEQGSSRRSRRTPDEQDI